MASREREGATDPGRPPEAALDAALHAMEASVPIRRGGAETVPRADRARPRHLLAPLLLALCLVAVATLVATWLVTRTPQSSRAIIDASVTPSAVASMPPVASSVAAPAPLPPSSTTQIEAHPTTSAVYPSHPPRSSGSPTAAPAPTTPKPTSDLPEGP